MLGLPHIPCHNHLLNNEVNAWIGKTLCVKGTLKSVNRTMTKVKGSLKNMAVLRKITKLRPEIGNATRWTGHGRMMRKYQSTRSDLMTAHDADDTNFPMNKSTQFKKKLSLFLGVFRTQMSLHFRCNISCIS